MKKLLFFVFIFMVFVAIAQKVKKIELIHEDQAFKNAKIFYGANKDINTKDFYLSDAYVGSYYVVNEKAKEGFALAYSLTTAYTHKLAKDKPNIIYTDRGQIVIN